MQSSWVLKVTAMITDELPRRPYDDPIIDDPTRNFAHGTTADIDACCNTPIDLELGAELYPSIRREGVIHAGVGLVEAHKTALGYVFVGPTHTPCLP